MEMRQIESFLSIAETLHFGRSSQQLHLSQPALSLQIKALEDELGVKLFDRNRQRTLLTEAGAAFRTDASAAMESLALAKRRVALAAAGKIGIVRVGFVSTAVHDIIPLLMRRYHKENPGVEFSLRNILTSEQTVMLRNGAFDVGFLRIPVADAPDLEVTPVHSEPWVVAVPAAHPLADAKDVRLRELAEERFVMYERKFAPGFHDQIDGMLNKAGVVPEVVQTAGEMPTLVSLVDAGLGIAILPKSALSRKPVGVKVCRITDRVAPSQIALVSSKQLESKVIRHFIVFAKAFLKANGSDDRQ